MPPYCIADFSAYPKLVISHRRAGDLMQGFVRACNRHVDYDTIFIAQYQLFRRCQLLGNIMQNARCGCIVDILAPTLGQPHCLLLAAHNMRDALWLQHSVGLFPQPVQIRLCPIQAIADNVFVNRFGQQTAAAALLQGIAHIRGSRRIYPRLQQCNARSVGFTKIRNMTAHPVVLIHTTQQHSNIRQLHNGFGTGPIFQRQDHIRAHDQHKGILGIQFLQLNQGVRGIASSLSAHFQIGDFCLFDLGKSQLTQVFSHIGRGRILCHDLMRGNAGGHDQQTIGLKQRNNRTSRFHMT